MSRLTSLAAGVLSLAVVLGGAGLVLAQAKDEPKKPDTPDLQKQIEDLRKELAELRKEMSATPRPLQGLRNLEVFPGGVRMGRTDGRLGVMVERPGDALADQLNLKSGKGLLVTDVVPDSPAAKAGLKPHDVLLQFDGKDVPDEPFEFARMINDVKADTAVELVLLRKGKQETVKDVKLPEARPMLPPGVRPFSLPRGLALPIRVEVRCGF